MLTRSICCLLFYEINKFVRSLPSYGVLGFWGFGVLINFLINFIKVVDYLHLVVDRVVEEVS